MNAIEDVYVRRYAGFCRGVSAFVGSGLAHDAVQEGFARALRRRHQYRGEGALDAWVWRIVLRAAHDLRRGQAPAEPVWPERDERDLDRDPDLAHAIRALPPRRRLFIFLRYYADLSYAEIADACGVAEGTVAASLAQAREELRNTLGVGETAR